MHIKSVTAEAFGPLVNETLTLSPGLTVVHGDNESAKSSWHAAIYAALCGRRRGKGANRVEDREFADRRRPWDRNSWKVRCEVWLDDGRTVTLRHDLDGKIDCCAVDERGRDVSSEVMYDGAPDGSRWLGLNRRTFAATACVNQAELLRVLDAADELQTDIQRAAATAGKDETAAAALAALKKYSSDQVGLNRVNSRKPLRRALDDLERARAAYDQAQRAHDDYLGLVVEAKVAEEAAVAATVERAAAEVAANAADRLVRAAQGVASAHAAAAQAQALADARRAKASASQTRSTRAERLKASAPDSEPAGSNDDDSLAQRVARALGGWESAPDIPRLTGPTSRHLQAEIDGLPALPAADPTGVEAAARQRDQAAAAVRAAEQQESAAFEAARHGAPPPQVPRDPSRLRALAMVAGALLFAVAIALFASGHAVGAAAVAAIAAGAVAIPVVGRSNRSTTARASARPSEETMLDQQVEAARAHLRQCREASLHAERAWIDVAARLADHARQSQRRDELEARLRDRLASERAADHSRQAKVEAVNELVRAARALHIVGAGDSTGLGDADALAERLRRWLHDRGAALERLDQQRSRWQELRGLLDGRSVEDLQAAAAADAEGASAAEHRANAASEHVQRMTAALEQAAGEAAAQYPLDEGGAQELLVSRRHRLLGAREREAELAREAASQHGKVAERKLSIPSVAEAEEVRARAQRELERVRSLGQVLDLTESFLEKAQETTYNNLAPVLSSALERWLPEVTGGRYRRARVDPETLAVRVESETGALRRAELLSVGTAEQVYLLLRVALAEHLADTSTVSPLLLDDVTVQADPTRTAAILGMCKALADDGRQVVLFAQEPSVLAWAEKNLDGRQHSLVRLTVPAAA